MTPSLAIATDNIYKFSCLFGLALIIVSVVSFVTMYSSTLDRKIRYSEIIIPLEAKTPRSRVDEDVLELNKKLIDVTRENERAANIAIGALFSFGLALSAIGAHSWYQKVQIRDDRIANLQVRKLEAELSKLEAEIRASGAGPAKPDEQANDAG
ncbi:hypothetical protein [Methylibium petroleiphilum]